MATRGVSDRSITIRAVREWERERQDLFSTAVAATCPMVLKSCLTGGLGGGQTELSPQRVNLIIADNGTGMTLDDLADWAKYHYTFDRRKQ